MNDDKAKTGTGTEKPADGEQGEVEQTTSTPVIEQMEQERKRVNPSTVPIDPRDPKQSP